jgi:hypothetical protein
MVFTFSLLAQLSWVGLSAAYVSQNNQIPAWYDCSTNWAANDFDGYTFNNVYSIKIGGECQSNDTSGDDATLGWMIKNSGGTVLLSGTINLPYLEPAGNNDKWQEIDPLTEVIDFNTLARGTTYYLHIWYYVNDNDEKNTVYDSNNSANYVATINTTLSAIWTGTTSSDWSSGNNWSGGQAPGNTDNVIVLNGLSNYPEIPTNGQITINSLNIIPGASLTIKSDATGTGSLIVEGAAEGIVGFERYLAETLYHYISSPVAGQAIDVPWLTNNSIVNTPAYQLFRWDEDNNYWIIYGSTGNPEAFDDVVFIPAKGYMVVRDGDGDLFFEGIPITTDVLYAATYTANEGEGFNMVGNPFSSSIALNEDSQAAINFLADNSALLDNSY